MAALLPGILLGYGMLVLSLGALSRLYVFTRANCPSGLWSGSPAEFQLRVPAQGYLHLAVHSFVSMIATGATVTLAFGEVDLSRTPSMRAYGMNTLVSFLDLAPASYVMPAYWLLTAFNILRFCVVDMEGLLRNQTSAWCKYIGLASDVMFGMVAAIFASAWSIDLESDPLAHELPFLFLVCCFPLVYVMQCWQASFKGKPPCIQIVTLSLYTHVSVFYALALVALRYKNMNPDYAKPLQWAWVLLSTACPLAARPGCPRQGVQPADGTAAEAGAPGGVRRVEVRPAKLASHEALAPTVVQSCPTVQTLPQRSDEKPLATLSAMPSPPVGVEEDRTGASVPATPTPNPFSASFSSSLSPIAPASSTMLEARTSLSSLSQAPRLSLSPFETDLAMASTVRSQVHIEGTFMLEDQVASEPAETVVNDVIAGAVCASAFGETIQAPEKPADEDEMEEV